MQIAHQYTGPRGSFYIEEDGERLAELVYKLPEPDKMIIEHTEVSEILRGKNIGYQLVKAAVEYARAAEMKIVPRCSFAHAIFQKRPELGDVLFTGS